MKLTLSWLKEHLATEADTAEIAQIRAKHAFLKPMLVEANSYPNQPVPIASVGSWSYILARETLPDDVAYRLAKTLHGAEATLGARLAQAKETTASNTVASAPDVARSGLHASPHTRAA